MRHKILWITFWTILAYWLGNGFGCAAGGQEENYKILNDEPVPARTEDKFSTGPQTMMLGTLVIAANEDQAQPAEQSAAAGGVQLATGESSLQGLDRSHWPKIVTGPADGRTVHGQIYWRDVQIGPSPTAMSVEQDPEAQLAATLEGADAHHLSRQNVATLFVQPLKFCVDSILLPIRVFTHPPTKKITTP